MLSDSSVIHFGNHEFRFMLRLAQEVGSELATTEDERDWVVALKQREIDRCPPDEDWYIEEGFEVEELVFWSAIFHEIVLGIYKGDKFWQISDKSPGSQVRGIWFNISLAEMFEACAQRKATSKAE